MIPPRLGILHTETLSKIKKDVKKGRKGWKEGRRKGERRKTDSAREW